MLSLNTGLLIASILMVFTTGLTVEAKTAKMSARKPLPFSMTLTSNNGNKRVEFLATEKGQKGKLNYVGFDGSKETALNHKDLSFLKTEMAEIQKMKSQKMKACRGDYFKIKFSLNGKEQERVACLSKSSKLKKKLDSLFEILTFKI